MLDRLDGLGSAPLMASSLKRVKTAEDISLGRLPTLSTYKLHLNLLHVAGLLGVELVEVLDRVRHDVCVCRVLCGKGSEVLVRVLLLSYALMMLMRVMSDQESKVRLARMVVGDCRTLWRVLANLMFRHVGFDSVR